MRREDEVAGLGRLERGLRGLLVAELADQDHVGVLAQHAPKRLLEGLGVEADLALVDDAALVDVDELDRVLDRDDVLVAVAVDLVEHRGEGRRLAGAGRARDEDQAAVLLGELRDAVGQAEPLEAREPRRARSGTRTRSSRAAGSR